MEIGKQIQCENPELISDSIKEKRLLEKVLMSERFTNYKITSIDINRKGTFWSFDCWSKYKREKRKVQITKG